MGDLVRCADMKRSVSDDDLRDDDDRGKRHRGGGGFRTEIRMLVPSRVYVFAPCACMYVCMYVQLHWYGQPKTRKQDTTYTQNTKEKQKNLL